MIHKKIKEKLKLSKYKQPKLIKLSKEQVEKLHAKGQKTPKEKLIELEKMDRCIFSNNLPQEKNRCKKYYRCRDCLIDYINKETKKEYMPNRLFKVKVKR